MKTKTVKQWLETLPKELSESAISQSTDDQLKKRCYTLHNALATFSIWSRTKEGCKFWYKIHIESLQKWNLDNPPKKLKSIFNP